MAALRKALENGLWQRQLDTVVQVTIGGCQDHCDHGPNMIIWPGPYRYAQLSAAALHQIIERHLLHNEPVTDLLATPAMRRNS